MSLKGKLVDKTIFDGVFNVDQKDWSEKNYSFRGKI